MNSNAILYSPGKNDECYTPAYAVEPILKYIPSGATVWCPFDDESSEFVKLISQQNKVVHTHIFSGQSFLTYNPNFDWDVIVSNPPFTNKRKYFEKALSFNKPFALIMSNTWLNDSAPKQLFKDKELQLLMFDKRIEFIQPDREVTGKVTFSSSYYCWNFLPKQIIMETLNRPRKSSTRK
jgi:hypothetical protein